MELNKGRPCVYFFEFRHPGLCYTPLRHQPPPSLAGRAATAADAPLRAVDRPLKPAARMPREGAAAPQLSAPPSPNSNLPTSPSQYANAISAIHRRTAARSASSLDDAVPASYHHPQSSDHGASTLRTLESDLMLAAQIGTALLEHKKELERKVDTLEKSNRQLLDRLTTEVKANNQSQRVSCCCSLGGDRLAHSPCVGSHWI